MSVRKSLFPLVLGLSLMTVAFTGCGKENTENLDAGMSLVEEQKYDEAISNFDTALASGEDKELVYRGRGLAYMGLGDYEKAADSFEEALHNGESIPKDVDYDINYFLAVCYSKQGKYDDALARYNAIAEVKPKWPDTYFLRGVVELKKGMHNEAVADFDKAIELNSKDYGMYIDIYCELTGAGFDTEGMKYLQVAVDSNDKGMSDYDKGRLYYYMGDYTNAKKFLEDARKDQKTEDVILLCGKAYENSGDREYALEIYNSFTEENPSAAVYNQMGICYSEMGNYAAAVTTFDKGLKVEDVTCRQELMFNQAVAYENCGEFVKAAEIMGQYVSLYPNDDAAQREYKFLKTR